MRSVANPSLLTHRAINDWAAGIQTMGKEYSSPRSAVPLTAWRENLLRALARAKQIAPADWLVRPIACACTN